MLQLISSVFQEENDFVKKISYLELWWPSCSVERNHLCNFGRGHHGEHSCEVFEIWTSGSGDVV